MTKSTPPEAQGLYDPANEHDACGVGFIAHIKGKKSHAIIEQGLQILRNLTHRGATGADPLAGDGAGILIQLPDQFFREEMAKQGIALPPLGEYGVGMVFLPQEPASRLACEYEIERAIKDEGQVLLGWRDVPRDNTGVGESVKVIEPVIRWSASATSSAKHPAMPSRRSSSRTAKSSTCRRCPRAPSCTKACCSRHRWALTTKTCRIRALRPHSRWCISAFPPIRFRPGISRILSV
jgi:glutamate synthase domain-containing protein 1